MKREVKGQIKEIMVETGDLLGINEAAKALGIHRITLWRWGRSGKITILHFGNVSYVLRSEVEAIQNDHQKTL